MSDEPDIEFDRWIDLLRDDVVRIAYGYAPGEFTVYPDEWRKAAPILRWAIGKHRSYLREFFHRKHWKTTVISEGLMQ